VAGLDELHHLGDPRGTDLRTALGLERFALARRDGSARPEAETAVAAALGMLNLRAGWRLMATTRRPISLAPHDKRGVERL
jgi:hypothetical protein